MSRIKLSHVLWGVSFVFLIILMSLLGYQIHLTHSILFLDSITLPSPLCTCYLRSLYVLYSEFVALNFVELSSNITPSSDADYSDFTQSITSAMDFSANPCNGIYCFYSLFLHNSLFFYLKKNLFFFFNNYLKYSK